MVKSINNRKGKSDRHQKHELKYARSHNLDTLERWYKQVTTPKIKRIVKRKKKEINNTNIEPKVLTKEEEIAYCALLFAQSIAKKKRRLYFIRKNKK